MPEASRLADFGLLNLTILIAYALSNLLLGWVLSQRIRIA